MADTVFDKWNSYLNETLVPTYGDMPASAVTTFKGIFYAGALAGCHLAMLNDPDPNPQSIEIIEQEILDALAQKH